MKERWIALSDEYAAGSEVVDPSPRLAGAPIGDFPKRPPVAWTGLDLSFIALGGLVLAAALLALLDLLVGLLEPFPLDVGAGATVFVVILALFIYGCVCFCAWFFVIRRRKVDFRDAGFEKVSPSTVLKMIPLGFGVLLLNGLVIGASRLIFSDVPTATEQVGAGAAPTAVELMLLAVVVVGVAPLVEEFLFRGLLLRYLLSKMRPVLAIGGSALVFAILHAVPVLIPALFLLGVFLGRVAYKYDSIYPAVALHAVNNGVAMLAVALTL